MKFVVVDKVDDVTEEEPAVVLDEMLCPNLVEVEFRRVVEVEVEFMF